jgi:hypothetical protein
LVPPNLWGFIASAARFDYTKGNRTPETAMAVLAHLNIRVLTLLGMAACICPPEGWTPGN